MSNREPTPPGEPTPPTTGPLHEPPPPPSAGPTSSKPAATSPAPAATETSAETSASGSAASGAPAKKSDDAAAAKVKGTQDDPLRGSFTSHTWIAIIALVVLLVLLAVFILQNTDPVAVNYFGFTGQSPLAVALLLAFAAGLLVAGIAGTLRIWQLRRRVRKLER